MRLAARSIALISLLVSACSFDQADHAQACESDRDCQAEARCYEGFCIAPEPPATGCAQTSRIESCYEGTPAATMGVGSCSAGQRICIEGEYSECLGQVLPDDELCNGKDDDCNGALDDIDAASTCDTLLRGACREGALLCRDGIEFCQPTHESQNESCNAIDDDCDGTTDEVGATVCYPIEAAGCMLDAQGAWQCNGQCATGQRSCDGIEESCSGAITPTEELCTPEATDTMLAQDEDCDGVIDESCSCITGQSRICYAGPVGTRGLGVCKAGMQECVGAQWGECTGQTLPSAETCANPGRDDDCNDVEDDVPGLGSACVALGESGVCRDGTLECTGEAEPKCVAGQASDELCDELDQDCDNDPTNGFDFNSDKTCGSCDVQCSPTETCCGGACLEVTDLQDDPDNCGACGRACGLGQYCCQGDCLIATGMTMAACACTDACGDKSCCGSNCRDLDRDKSNCGACGRKCRADESCRAGGCVR